MKRLMTIGLVLTSLFTLELRAAEEASLQKKIDARVDVIRTWATNPAIVSAVKTHNGGLRPDETAMTQEKWKTLSVLDPFVRTYTKNDAATFLKSCKDGCVTEAFVSGADGKKVAFLAKTSGWSHAGKVKHDDPMAGKTWQGEAELDESTGIRQVQVSVPVLENGKPIGSLVVGLNLAKL